MSQNEKVEGIPESPTKELYADDSLDSNCIVEGSNNVTQHEFETLRHVPDSLPYSAWLVIVVEFAERWSYYGVSSIFSNYVRFPLPPLSNNGRVVIDVKNGVAGALGQGIQTSFSIRTFNSFWSYVTPILGGILADTLWGRYKTIWVFSIVCLIGHVILIGSASPSVLAQPDTALGLLVLCILLIGLGAGGIKANVSPMIAEQYVGKIHKSTLPSGEIVLKTPAVTYQRIYLWFYAAINLGSCGAISAPFMARNHGYWVAFTVPTFIFLLVPIVLVYGRGKYVTTPPRGSILLETIRVIKICGVRWLSTRSSSSKKLSGPTFWDVAKPSSYPLGEVPITITWDDEFVGEVDRTVNACAVFLFFPFYWLCYSQIDGNLANVAAGMVLNGTPNDLIGKLNPISIIIMVPIFDKILYPMLRKYGINFSPIKRIYTGFLVAGLAMVYAAVLEQFLYEKSPCQARAPSACVHENKTHNPAPVNVWIVAGPYILVAMSEILANVTSLEYAFTKAPLRMKSVVTAFSLFQTAISAAINFALVPVNVEERYVWLFASFAIVAWIVGTIFMITFRKLDKRDSALNVIGTGDRVGFKGEEGRPQKILVDRTLPALS